MSSFLRRSESPKPSSQTAAAQSALPSEATVSGAGGVSLAALYQAIADSQKQITDYLLTREAECCMAGGGTAAAGVLAGNMAVAQDPRLLALQLKPVLERIEQLGQFMDEQMMKTISDRFDSLEATLKAQLVAPSMSGTVSVGSETGAEMNSCVNPGTVAESAEINANAMSGTDSTESGMVSEQNSESNAGSVAGQAPVPSASGPMFSRASQSSVLAQLDSAIFGEMALDPSIQNERQYVLQGILMRDPVCAYLGGILQMFQSSTPEKMILLLKDLGEAFYRLVNSLPDSSLEHFEDVICRWSQQLCESAGLPNHIELVTLGQRFDATRHNSTTRGVMVTCVHGWVVLRGNGSVYSKALVDVQ